VVSQLVDMHRRREELLHRDGRVAEDEYFYAEQNARVAAHAERYYRTMLDAEASSWNLRDTHMVDTLERLAQHLDRRLGRSKIVVWAHNSHVGDARHTDMSRRGEHNIGQLMRERHGTDTVSIGFTTCSGTVTAASAWHGVPERKRVLPARPDSFEHLFHQAGVPEFFLNLRSNRPRLSDAGNSRLERAIGVIYRPETERASHYFYARLAEQFDGLVHIDVTRAVEPLERNAEWDAGEVPETYPFGA
jgi:erythromycin esterase-like protein